MNQNRFEEYQTSELARLTQENRFLKESVSHLKKEVRTLRETKRNLQERLNINSQNSSLPSSHDRRRKKTKKRTKEKSFKAQDIQDVKNSRKKDGVISQKSREADYKVSCPLPTQCTCGGNILN